MVPVLLIGIPLLAGLIGFSLKDAAAKGWSLFASLLTLIVSLVGILLPRESKLLSFSTEWMGSLNSHFSVGLDGTGQILCLLTALAFPIIFISTWEIARSFGKTCLLPLKSTTRPLLKRRSFF